MGALAGRPHSRLSAYNREDTINLRRLMDLVGERLHEEVFVAARDGGE